MRRAHSGEHHGDAEHCLYLAQGAQPKSVNCSAGLNEESSAIFQKLWLKICVPAIEPYVVPAQMHAGAGSSILQVITDDTREIKSDAKARIEDLLFI